MYLTNEPTFISIYRDPRSWNFLYDKNWGQNRCFKHNISYFLTAIIGVYFAKLEGLRSYQNKIPIFEIASGASIAIAAVFLIVPGFLTDALGFLLLIPFTRKILIKYFFKINNNPDKNNNKTLDGEIIEKEKDEL